MYLANCTFNVDSHICDYVEALHNHMGKGTCPKGFLCPNELLPRSAVREHVQLYHGELITDSNDNLLIGKLEPRISSPVYPKSFNRPNVLSAPKIGKNMNYNTGRRSDLDVKPSKTAGCNFTRNIEPILSNGIYFCKIQCGQERALNCGKFCQAHFDEIQSMKRRQLSRSRADEPL